MSLRTARGAANSSRALLMNSVHVRFTLKVTQLLRSSGICAKCPDIPTPRPQPGLRVPEISQQPRRCHVSLQSRMRHSRLQLPVSRRLWPRFRCEEEFPDNKQRPEGAARMHGFVRLSSRSPHGRNLRPPVRRGSCSIVVAVRRAHEARRIVRKNPCESIRHIIRKYILLDAIPHVEQKMSSRLQDSLGFAVGR